ncbi:MAG: 30S ribosome-binding factor RbfA [Candidatus Eisenbacteria bacterium]
MASKKNLRVAASLQRELGFILDRKLEDPKLGMITITRTELSDDLRYAKVYVSFLGGCEASESLKRLRHARRFLRGELASCLDLRVVPDLTFLLDDSSENYIRIAKVLKEIERDQGGEADPEGAGIEPRDAGSAGIEEEESDEGAREDA